MEEGPRKKMEREEMQTRKEKVVKGEVSGGWVGGEREFQIDPASHPITYTLCALNGQRGNALTHVRRSWEGGGNKLGWGVGGGRRKRIPN